MGAMRCGASGDSRLALADCRAHEDAAIRVAVNGPERAVRLRPDGGGAGGAVDECELAERPALADLGDLVDAAVLLNLDRRDAGLDDVKVIA